jgi:S-DNA-T family DNA segregation ATPase FtsK/SpoIIIE
MSKKRRSSAKESAESTGPAIPPYNGPSLDLLEKTKASDAPDSGNVEENKQKIQSTLQSFGIEVEMGEVYQGPTVTRYLLRPVNRVKLSRITALQDNIKLALEGGDIRMKAPVPGYFFVGIEVPNAKRAIVRLRELLESDAYQDDSLDLPLTLGKNIRNEPVVEALEKMPHLLIGGTTGSGKSMQLHSMILSLLYRNSPEDVRFIFVDLKRVEFAPYNDIPHLLTPVIEEQEEVVNALHWCVQEIERRAQIFSQTSLYISGYNKYVKKCRSKVQTPEEEAAYEPLPRLVVVVDELAELMLTRKTEIEPLIAQIANAARAVGIHFILATQKPSVDVVTGLIKANFPARIGLNVPSTSDSRTILDAVGAEALLGNGDMLFLGSDDPHLQRVQGAYVSEQEITDVIAAVKQNAAPAFHPNVVQSSQPGGGRGLAGSEGGSEDPLFEQAKEMVVRKQKASATFLQRSLKVGFARASNLLEDLEEAGVVGPEPKKRRTKPRGVLWTSGEVGSEDPLFEEAKEVVVRKQKGSATYLQRRLKVGYARALNLLDALEEAGVVGPEQGTKPREVLQTSVEENV